MEVSSIGTTLSAQSQAQTAQQALLGQEEFLRILLAQLSFQDPLEPMDNQEFIAQLAQFTELEQTRQLTNKTDDLLIFQSAQQSVNLLGRTVQVNLDTGNIIGEVTTITFNQGVPELTIRTDEGDFITQVGLSSITIVR